MDDQQRHWRVRAIRSSGSVFGAAQAFCKDQGFVLRFASEGDARQYAERLRASTVSPNVSYVPAGPFPGPVS